MYRIVKTGYIDMAHRIRGHKGKCRFLHGHTWKIELSVSCEDGHLNELGMVIDFGELKKKFFLPVTTRFDHSCALSFGDKEAVESGRHTAADGPLNHTSLDHLADDLGLGGIGETGCELNIHFPVSGNLSAETLAKMLFTMAVTSFSSVSVKVDYVRVYEQLHPTESYAEYRPTKEQSC